jgi:uncharacterized repeat protein (TIGR01451 family)
MTWTSLLALGLTLVSANGQSVPVASGSEYAGNGGWAKMGTWTVPATPALTISTSHGGTFTRGQNGATYTITVSNSVLSSPTAGVVTVTDVIPQGLSLLAMAGTGWACPQTGNTCTRNDALAGGAVYPAITVTVNVAADAPSQVTNQASVSGGGSPSANASDVTAIQPNWAVLASPTPGSTLVSTSVLFTWNLIPGADQYWLDIGTSAGIGDLWHGALTSTTQAVTGLPCDGRTLYVQLFTHSGVWNTPQRYTYTAPSGCFAVMNSPSPGTVLSATTVTFAWSAASGADQYWLDVGTSPGHGDLSAGSTTSTSKTATGLPCDGRTLYVQLFTHVGGVWQTPQRYTYTADPACWAQMISPVPFTTLPATTATFTWGPVAAADQYWLDVGNSAGQGDISAGAMTTTSKTIAGLPCDGRTLYVQLYTSIGGWQTPQRYTYTTMTGCAAPLAQMSSPTPLTTLSGATVEFSWSAATGADQYWLDVGEASGRGDIYGGALSSTSHTVAGLPCDGRTLYVQLFTHVNGAWQVPQRYTYTAHTGCAAQLAPEMRPM